MSRSSQSRAALRRPAFAARRAAHVVLCAASATVAALGPSAAAAQRRDASQPDRPASLRIAQAAAADTFTKAEVRRVDREGRKLTLKHAEIRNLEMPPMTMVFQVADPSMLEGLKPGDAVRFRAVQRNGAYVVTDIERPR